MPQLPNSPDVNTQKSNPENAIMPDQAGMAQLSNEQSAVNLVEQRPLPQEGVLPPSNYVEDRFNQFGERLNKGLVHDTEFYNYFQGQLSKTREESAAKENESLKEQFTKAYDSLTVDRIGIDEQVKKIDTSIKAPVKVIPPIVNGLADAFVEGTNALISMRNFARRQFGLDETTPLPEVNVFEDDADPGMRFVRSSTKLMAEIVPMTVGLTALGAGSIPAMVGGSAIAGFVFDSNKTEGLIGSFIKENPEIAPDVLAYMNHELDDNEFQTRIKNAVQYGLDGAVFEGVFLGLKGLNRIARGKRDATQVLQNGDVVTTGKVVAEDGVAVAKKGNAVTDLRIKGLTTEDAGGRTASEAIQADYLANIKKMSDLKNFNQDAVLDRKSMSHAKSIKEAFKNPMSFNELLNRKFNDPVNSAINVQYKAAAEAVDNYVVNNIFEKVKEGKMTDGEANVRLQSITPVRERLTDPFSTAGRALESTKIDITEVTGKPNYSDMIFEKIEENATASIKELIELAELKHEGLTGLAPLDVFFKALKKGPDLKKAGEYIHEAHINWMLSDPTTFIVGNIASNATLIPMRLAETAVAAGISKSKTALYGNSYMSRGIHGNEFMAEVKGLAHGVNQVVKVSLDNIKTAAKEGTIVSPNLKPFYKENSYKYSTDKIDLNAQAEFARNWKDAPPISKGLIVVSELFKGTPISKIMRLGDSAFKAINYSMEVSRQYAVLENQMLRHASNIADPKEKASFIKSESARIANIKETIKKAGTNQAFDAGISTRGKRIISKARESATYGTFTDAQIGEDLHTALWNSIGGVRTGVPGMKILSPFFGFGASLSNKILERTPVLGLIIKAKNFSGSPEKTTMNGVAGLISGGREEDLFLGKQGVGFILTSGTAIALTSIFDENDIEISSSNDYNQGIRINGVSLPADAGNPAFRLLTATKDIMDIINLAEQEDAGDVAATALATLAAELYTPVQLMEILGAINEATSGPQKELVPRIKSMLKSTAMSYITPYSGAMRFVKKMRGETKADIGQERGEDLIDEMMKRLKHLYLGDDVDIPKRYGIFGQEIPYNPSMGWEVSSSAHQMFAGYSIDDPVIKEIIHLTRDDVMMNPDNYNEYQLDNTVMLQMPKRSMIINGESVKLTPKEYSEYVKLSGGIGLSPNIPTLKTYLDKMVTSPKFLKRPAADRIALINNVINRYRVGAKARLYKDNPKLQQEARQSMQSLQQEYRNVK